MPKDDAIPSPKFRMKHSPSGEVFKGVI